MALFVRYDKGVEVNEVFMTALALFGGLAMFLYGMNLMSDSLQKVAGERMRSILALLTKNPLLGVLAGALTTAVIQSSSATTVMAIGFVSAGLMGLPQAISIILGANIGTTMTAQIIAFKITDYIMIFVFIGFLMHFLGRTERMKNIGASIFGFGLLFLGIETMGDAMKPLASSPIFIDMISSVKNIPILGVAVGTLMTVVVQSSSATIAVLQNLASQAGPDGVTSVIGLQGAIPVLLGDNIGTTITAILASLTQSRNAKRVAASHCLFNVSGTLLFIWFIPQFAALVQMISPSGPEVEVISRQIANAHTCFNVIMTCIWLPLIPVMVKIVMKVLPLKESEMDGPGMKGGVLVPMHLDNRLLGQPVAALQLVAQEVDRCGEVVRTALHDVAASLRDKDVERLDQAAAKATSVDTVCHQANEYLAELFAAGSLTESQAAHTANLMRALGDVERVGALCSDVVESSKKNNFSMQAVEGLQEVLLHTEEMFAAALRAMATGSQEEARVVFKMNVQLGNMNRKLRKGHMKRVEEGTCSPELTGDFNRVVYDIGRIGSGCANIAELAIDDVDMEYFEFITEQEVVPSA